jgi:hypothetical protein
MDKTSKHTTGIIGIINRARIYNSEIGYYREHFVNEKFGYTISLNNGRLEMSIEISSDYEIQPESVSEERIKRVAKTFIKQ